MRIFTMRFISVFLHSLRSTEWFNTRLVKVCVLASSLLSGLASAQSINYPGNLNDLDIWKTRTAPCLQAGDRLVIDSSSSIRGELIVKPCSGAKEGNYIIESSSNTSKPLIIGSHKVENIPGIYIEQVYNPTINGKAVSHLVGDDRVFKIGPFPHEVSALFKNGSTLPQSRYPNTPRGPDHRIWLKYSNIDHVYYKSKGQVGLPSVISPASASDFPDLKYHPNNRMPPPGMFAWFRDEAWSWSASKMIWASHKPGSNSFAVEKDFAATNYVPKKGSGFVLFNSLAVMDQPGEWAYDPSSKYVYFINESSKTPQIAKFDVNYKNKTNNGVTLVGFNSSHHVKVRNIKTTRHNGAGFRSAGKVGRLTIKGNEVYSSRSGIAVFNATDRVIIDNNTIRFVAQSGIYASKFPGFEESNSLYIRKNKLSFIGNNTHPDTKISRNMSQRGYGILGTHSRRIEISGNDISFTAYAGITSSSKFYGAGEGLYIQNNKIRYFCYMLNDCGAIYINDKNRAKGSFGRKLISENIISDGRGNTNGSPKKEAISPSIYLDIHTSYYKIRGNIIDRSRSARGGIFVHGGNGNHIYCNKVDSNNGSKHKGVFIAELKYSGGPIVEQSENRIYYNDFRSVYSFKPIQFRDSNGDFSFYNNTIISDPNGRIRWNPNLHIGNRLKRNAIPCGWVSTWNN